MCPSVNLTALLGWRQDKDRKLGKEKVEVDSVACQEKAFLFTHCWYCPDMYWPPWTLVSFVNPRIVDVKILFVKEFRVNVHFWVSCPMLTDASGEQMIIHVFHASKWFCLIVCKCYSKGSITSGLSEGRYQGTTLTCLGL